MDIMIRKATASDLDAVAQGYTEQISHDLENGRFTIWELGVYPTRCTAEKSLAEGSLFVAEVDGEIAASMIANQVQPEEYGAVSWSCDAPQQEVLVVHLLCVRPSRARSGMGSAMVRFAAEQARQMGCRTVRLDTGAQNIPAFTLYQKLGFRLAGTASMNVGGVIAHRDHLFLEMLL